MQPTPTRPIDLDLGDVATGRSENGSFDEAFENALENLAPPPCTYPDQLIRTVVEEIGYEQGGFAGFNDLYVRVRRLPDPVCSRGGGQTFPRVPARVGEGGEEAVNVEASPFEKVYSIDEVRLDVLESQPPQLVVHARGQVNSSGWTEGHLVPVQYVQPPTDGIWDATFVARPPTGIVFWAFQPIQAAPYHWGPFDPKELKGIRVIAETNDIVERLDGSNCTRETPRIGPYADGPPAGGGS